MTSKMYLFKSVPGGPFEHPAALAEVPSDAVTAAVNEWDAARRTRVAQALAECQGPYNAALEAQSSGEPHKTIADLASDSAIQKAYDSLLQDLEVQDQVRAQALDDLLESEE